MLADGLESAGVHVRYRGQDISEAATFTGRQRFGERFDAQVATGDTLLHDAFDDFDADLVIVDPPRGLRWVDSAAPEARQGNGSIVFGFPQPFDSTWLFISLALEKLRPAARDVVPTEQAGHARYALPPHGPEPVAAIRDLEMCGRDRFHYERETRPSASARRRRLLTGSTKPQMSGTTPSSAWCRSKRSRTVATEIHPGFSYEDNVIGRLLGTHAASPTGEQLVDPFRSTGDPHDTDLVAGVVYGLRESGLAPGLNISILANEVDEPNAMVEVFDDVQAIYFSHGIEVRKVATDRNSTGRLKCDRGLLPADVVPNDGEC